VDILESQQLEKEPLAMLQARLQAYRRAPINTTDNAWQGMHRLPVAIKLNDFDAEHSQQKSEAFIQQRLEAINVILSQEPYICLTGLTGVGKSTFVEKYLEGAGSKVYKGESRLREWAQDASDQRKILFIDEANITNRNWSEFEGLYNNPPGILIDGTYHQLTSQHYICCAANPKDYSANRHIPSFFQRHGNALVFEPMPLEYIYEEILKPVFANTELASQSLDIAQKLLPVYRFLVECSQGEVLISVRELQMMALFILNYHQQNPQADLSQVATHYAYHLGKDLSPTMYRDAFDKQFKPQEPLQQEQPTSYNKKFLMTPSRQFIQQQLNDFLGLRQFKRHQATNDQQKYGGLGGIILEGEPGIGKSELVRMTLLAQGYEEAFLDKPTDAENSFYRMPVSMQPEEKKQLLLRAFHEGAVVIIDEINSSSLMERLVNDLLMGKTPEGKRPAQPGFFIIGTQNPANMGGRRTLGNALARRLLQTTLPNYNAQEMKTILSHKGLSPELVERLVTIYEKKRNEARTQFLSPAPNFRDLLKLAKQFIKAEKKRNAPLNLTSETIEPMQTESTASKKRGAELEHEVPEDIKRVKVNSASELRYREICNHHGTKLQKIKALLSDYTNNNNNSYSLSFFKEAQHVTHINNLLQHTGEEKDINTLENFMEQFSQIKMPDNETDIISRIRFIHHLINTESNDIEMKDSDNLQM
jgi:energy-coupling factor transporter ATP-binding protein EcfA2